MTSISRSRTLALLLVLFALPAASLHAQVSEVTARPVPDASRRPIPSAQDPVPFPVDLSTFSPMPTPTREGAPSQNRSAAPPQGLVSYDVRTGQTTTVPAEELPQALQNVMQGSFGTFGDDRADFDLSRKSEQHLVSNPTGYPWRMAVKVFFTLNGFNFFCSGSLIDYQIVLTAGHCLNNGFGGFATFLAVAPAYNNGTDPYPFGWAFATRLGTTPEWNVGMGRDFDHDMGWAVLDRPVGFITGWAGYRVEPDDAFYTDGNTRFITPGYPVAIGGGHVMITQNGFYDYVTPYQMCYDNQPFGGQSGSGVFDLADGSATVNGVVSNGTPALDLGCDVRHTEDMARLTHFFTRWGRSTSFDLALLNARARPSGSPAAAVAGARSINDMITAYAGLPLGNLSVLVANPSTKARTGTWYLDAYLSPTTDLSGTPHYLGSYAFDQAFQAGEAVTVNVPPLVLPNGLTGRYYLGFVLVAEGDRNPANNVTRLFDTQTIDVVGTTQVSFEALAIGDVPIEIQPADLLGRTGGAMSFSRRYPEGTLLRLQAPPASGWRSFQYWLVDGSVHATTTETTVEVGAADRTVTAVYDASLERYALTVRSEGPASGVKVKVSPADGDGQSNGLTPFARSYASGTEVTLTARGRTGSGSFVHWLVDGAVATTSRKVTVIMDGDHTVTTVYGAPGPSVQANAATETAEPAASTEAVAAGGVESGLSEAYPNPFNPATMFEVQVDVDQHVRVGVYDLLGRRVALLYDGVLNGERPMRLTFDAGGLPSGVYLLRAEGERFADVQRITLLK